MALSIKDAATDQLAREVADLAGETLTEAIRMALDERLRRLRAKPTGRRLADELDEIALRCAALPDLDTRTPDEIIGYDEHGRPR